MKFQVPQFIEVEDKIFGPLTIKQFIYLAGGAGLSVVIYLVLPYFLLKAIFIIPVIALSCSLAFVRINNRPFINVLESAFVFIMHPKLYIWKQEQNKPAAIQKSEPVASSTPFIPKLSNSKLKDLTWTLDTKGTSNPITRENQQDK